MADNASSNFLKFLGQDPSREQFINRGLRGQNFGSQPFGEGLRRTTATIGNQVGGFGAQALPLGLSTLNEILFSQGKIDPRSRNRALVNVGRNTESQVTANRQSAAGAGLQGSGVVGAGGAVEAALRASGADRAAAVDADFVQQEEQRKRSDLALLLELIINPSLQGANVAAGLEAQNVQSSAAERQGNQQFGSELLRLILGGR